ncbi:hypothetical protein [Microcoleus sp. CAWBG58]|uniref:hypothetical protein n=1 Tax=Microcoleus sp. CAWBG58 TaxID=2841651 RepID=UPI0025FB9030|nr:hypothetical protein [Microcoleus sp. CAWBG58]
MWTLVRNILRTKVHTTNGFCYGNRPDVISLVICSPTINCQLSTVNCQLRGQARTIHCPYNCQLSTVNCQLSTVNCQLSTVNF